MKQFLYIPSLLFLGTILLVSPACAEDVWRCPNGTYTNNPRNSSSCTPVDISTLCGKNNRYITPARKQFFNKDELCGHDASSKRSNQKQSSETQKESSSGVTCLLSNLIQGRVAFSCSNE